MCLTVNLDLTTQLRNQPPDRRINLFKKFGCIRRGNTSFGTIEHLTFYYMYGRINRLLKREQDLWIITPAEHAPNYKLNFNDPPSISLHGGAIHALRSSCLPAFFYLIILPCFTFPTQIVGANDHEIATTALYFEDHPLTLANEIDTHPRKDI